MRTLISGIALMVVFGAAGCGSGSDSPAANNPVVPTSGSATAVTGVWTGTASDSTGTMMGAGLSSSMMSGMTWQLTQNGNSFTGTMQFPGYTGGSMMGGSMTVSGTITGKTGTFTMTMPNGSMMSGSCSAVGNGTFDMDDLMVQMHGTYAGTNTCFGTFNQGQISMSRR